MVKRVLVTDAELSNAAEAASDIRATLHNLSETIRRDLGWADDVAKPITYALEFAGLAKAAANLSAAILTKLSMEDDRRELQAKLTDRSS